MKAYHLTESSMPQTVAIIFGRFNPPHKGHRHAWETASQSDAWFVGTNQSTVGPEDPLPFEVKIEAMKAIMPAVEDHLVAEQSWWTLAAYVFKKFGGVPGRTLPFELIVITDEPYVTPGLLKQNGVNGPHGEYSFKNIRIPFDSIEAAKKHLRISSATALRNAVAAGDREAFAEAAGVAADTPVAGHAFFDLVAHYLLPHREAQAAKDKQKAEKVLAKQAKDQAKQAKDQAKAKGPAQELAESLKVNEKSVSQAQFVTMAAAAKNPKFAKKVGISSKVAKDFHDADKKQNYKSLPKKKVKENYVRISQALNQISESGEHSIQDDVARALPSTYAIPELQNQDAYKQYRYGVALAQARGSAPDNNREPFSPTTPWGENQIVVAYDNESDIMIKQALEFVGLSSSAAKRISTPGSKESKSVAKTSPVANIKRNKYGI